MAKFCHHVDKSGIANVGLPAVYNDRTRSASVALIHLSVEQQGEREIKYK
jgi:hypothetical protein